MLRTAAERFSIPQRLSAMMFLQFFVWGAWYVVGPLYLGTIGFDEVDFGWMYSVGPIAGMISPFFVGMIADRFFSTEKVLGTMHLLGGAAMLYATTLMHAEVPDPDAINIAFFTHMLFYMPTLALTNSLSLHTMTDPESQFPMIRVFGTIGWVVVGVLISWLAWDASVNVFYLAAGTSILLGAYSFSLPHTPPPLAGEKVSARELIGADAFVLFKHKPFLVFMFCSFLICIPLAFYYQLAARSVGQAGIANVGGTMAYGQMSEILFMVLMPLFFKRLGVKYMLLFGMAAWVLRYALFAFGAPLPGIHWMLFVGIVLHGICYDFFFVTGQIYTDKVAPKEIRGQAQGMLALFTLGLGMMIGALCAGQVEGWFTPEESANLHEELKGIGTEVKKLDKELEAKTLGLSDEKQTLLETQSNVVSSLKSVYSAGEAEAPDIEGLNSTYETLTGKTFDSELIPALSLQSKISDLGAESSAKGTEEQQLKRWRWIWLLPCFFAAAIMAGFFMTFHETEELDSGEVDPDEIEPPLELADTPKGEDAPTSESSEDGADESETVDE